MKYEVVTLKFSISFYFKRLALKLYISKATKFEFVCA
jgi:hypothetical protein